MLDSRTKASGFYRGDAARLVSEAARQPAEPAPGPEAEPAAEAARAPTPAIIIDEPQRPPLSPAAPTNQNMRMPLPYPDNLAFDGRSAWTTARIVAWILLAPWYVAIAMASVGVDVLFVKDLLGL